MRIEDLKTLLTDDIMLTCVQLDEINLAMTSKGGFQNCNKRLEKIDILKIMISYYGKEYLLKYSRDLLEKLIQHDDTEMKAIATDYLKNQLISQLNISE